MPSKTYYCDGCAKQRKDVIPCGKDYNGDPDAPCLCFICRKENERNRTFNRKLNCYVSNNFDVGDIYEV